MQTHVVVSLLLSLPSAAAFTAAPSLAAPRPALVRSVSPLLSEEVCAPPAPTSTPPFIHAVRHRTKFKECACVRPNRACSQKKPALSGGRVAATAVAAATATLLVPTAAHAATLAIPGIADSAFVQASSLIFISEIGDKTFFIAALLAARASRLLTFAGCAGALAFMTAVSVVIGQVFHGLPDSFTRGLPIDDYVAIASFLYFGVKSLLDAFAVEEDGAGISEEREEAVETLESVDVTGG